MKSTLIKDTTKEIAEINAAFLIATAMPIFICAKQVNKKQ